MSASELDRYGLSNALKLACRRAVKQVLATKISFDEITIDGTVNFLADTPLSERVTILKKADFLVKEVSAASIIAKVARDNYMIKMSEKYPNYGFEKHVGYGTAAHQSALSRLGPCPEHRRSFRPIRELLESTHVDPSAATATRSSTDLVTPTRSFRQNTTKIGQTAEAAVLDFLVKNGHRSIAQNFKTKLYEIDLITTFENQIFFTEVKFRKSSSHGSPLASITPQKQRQITFAAESFLATHPEFKHLAPKLAVAGVIPPNYHVETWFPLED